MKIEIDDSKLVETIVKKEWKKLNLLEGSLFEQGGVPPTSLIMRLYTTVTIFYICSAYECLQMFNIKSFLVLI
jgi:hypothetical protein